MADINIRDRDILNSFQARGPPLWRPKERFCFSKGYLLDDNDDTTAAMNTFTGGNILDMMMIYSCVGRHTNSSPVMVTQHAQRYNTKQNMTKRTIQTLIF